MPKTEVRSAQIKDATVGRSDVNVATPGEAVVAKIVAGTGVSISSTGADTGTGDVTITASGGGGGGDVYLNVANVFTQDQYISKSVPILNFVETDRPADTKRWVFASYASDFYFQAYNDSGGVTSQVLLLKRTGEVLVTNHIIINNASARLMIGGQTAAYSAIRSGVGPRLECVAADNATWVPVTAQNFTSMGTGNNLSDLTVTGGIQVNASLNATGNISAGAAISSGGAMYPGRQDVPGTSQFTWYLASHGSYGLFSNTGLYLSGGLTINAGGANITGTTNLNILNVNAGPIEGASFIRAAGYLYDRARPLPIFYPIDGGTITFSGWTYTSTISNEYYLGGHYLVWNMGFTGNVPAGVSTVAITLPAGYTPHMNWSGALGYCNNGGTTRAGHWYVNTSSPWVTFGRVDAAGWATGYTDIRATVHVRVA